MNSMHGWHLQSARTLPVIVVPLSLAVLLGAAGCTDSPESLDQQGQAVISDAVHGPEASRVAGFYFLPPVVQRPALRGAFVPEVSPTVQIDRIDPATGATLRAIATFTRAGDHDGAAIRVRRQSERCEGDDEDGPVDDPNGYFWVRWRTRGLHLSTDAKYRIRVSVPGGRELGFADVRVVDRERDRRAIDRNEFVALRRERDLMIRFRIDRPAVDGDGDGVFDWDDNCPALANADQRDSVGDHVGDACRCLGVSCAASDACHLVGTCDPTTGACSNPAASDGTECGAGQVCRAAVCVSVAPPPRLTAPLSTATVTSRRPTLRWALAGGTDGARVEVCRDRACSTVVAAFDAVGTGGAPAADLPPGVLFWRTRGRVGTSIGTTVSPTWEFTVGARSAPVNTSWGTTLDVNGDGYADVVVGAADRTYVYLGGAGGLAVTPATTLTGSDGPGGGFGASVASAGDVNGDGYADLVVGARAVANDVGRAYVYLGGAGGLSSTPATTLTETDETVQFGSSVASAGDINGDGFADLVVGALVWPSIMPSPITLATRAYVYLGGAGGLSSTPSATLTGTDRQDGQWRAVSVASAGDVTGDGYADLVVGAQGTDAGGRAYVYFGGAAGPSSSPVMLERFGENSLFGRSVASAGDTNGDGYADLVVGAPFGTGRAYVFLGLAGGLATTPATTLTDPDGPGGVFGTSVASAAAVPPGRPRDHHSSPTSLPASAGPRPPRASAAVCRAPRRAIIHS
jgi:hypothetical protein